MDIQHKACCCDGDARLSHHTSTMLALTGVLITCHSSPRSSAPAKRYPTNTQSSSGLACVYKLKPVILTLLPLRIIPCQKSSVWSSSSFVFSVFFCVFIWFFFWSCHPQLQSPSSSSSLPDSPVLHSRSPPTIKDSTINLPSHTYIRYMYHSPAFCWCCVNKAFLKLLTICLLSVLLQKTRPLQEWVPPIPVRRLWTQPRVYCHTARHLHLHSKM